MTELLKITDLKANIRKKEILHGVNLNIRPNEIHVIMGPNGSGKSTLANVLMGNKQYSQTTGSILINGFDISQELPETRAIHGLFLAFQYPREIAGIQLDNFLFTAYKNITQQRITLNKKKQNKPMNVFKFRKELEKEADILSIKKDLLSRSINQGFSGGEKKKAEMLQLALLDPKVAILDETDSGLDVDSLKIVATAINRFMNEDKAVLLITHYQRILEYLDDYIVHIMIDGKIIKTGGKELTKRIEKEGYGRYR